MKVKLKEQVYNLTFKAQSQCNMDPWNNKKHS